METENFDSKQSGVTAPSHKASGKLLEDLILQESKELNQSNYKLTLPEHTKIPIHKKGGFLQWQDRKIKKNEVDLAA